MNTNEYCNSVSVELAGWQSKLNEIVKRFDSMSTGEKERIVPEVNKLHIIIDELSERMEKLSTACLTNWEPRKEDHEVAWPDQSERTFETVSQSDFGG